MASRHTHARTGVICLEELRRLGKVYGEIRELKRQLSPRPQLTAVSWTPDREPVQETLAVRPRLTMRERRKLTAIKQQEKMMAGAQPLELRPSIEFGVTQPPAVGQRVDVALSSAGTSCWLAATVQFVGILRNSRALGLMLGSTHTKMSESLLFEKFFMVLFKKCTVLMYAHMCVCRHHASLRGSRVGSAEPVSDSWDIPWHSVFPAFGRHVHVYTAALLEALASALRG